MVQLRSVQSPEIIWESLPADFILPDDPVESILQPLLAAALTEALELAGMISPPMLIASNMALAVRINGKTVVKAPDWFFVPRVLPVGQGVIRRSYTPHQEGDIPAIVMEFLSESDGGEYSSRPTPPYGKFWFYEQVIGALMYIIFDPADGLLEVRVLEKSQYQLARPNESGHYWVESLGLFLGVWQGKRLGQDAYWLRWWDREGNLLLWGSERIALEQQRTEQERRRAEAEKQRADAVEQELARLRQLLPPL
ncbi:MAG: Uma2 family endonuclease [Cyanobacteria bacterium KgW148]|nr:Uma2 family endonuclease [Cyanobacteria bacterium KgW148]